jgi:peptidoglycan/LPS O-acetylase OafA/YrhL
MMEYRREIDGLRALAVVPVILFHAGLSAFSGGFVGVDIFFVISGYLITSILLNDVTEGKFSLISFYERRARRIFPALALVLLICIPISFFWLMPNDLKSFSQSLSSVTVFSSNILFWKSSGYFDSATELKPLLHTWSLAIEEQYYLFFPLLLVFFWKRSQRSFVTICIFLTCVSFFFAEWSLHSKFVDSAFYLLPSRAWELLLGSLAGVLLFVKPPKFQKIAQSNAAKETLCLIGLALILYSIFSYSAETPFPGIYALAPTLGTVLIILFCDSQTIVGKTLSTKLFVGIGLISYSSYLWHQPMFAFARHRTLEEPSHELMLFLIAATFLAAYLSWRYVERPFRNRAQFSRSRIFVLTFVISATLCVVGLVGHFTKGHLKRFTSEQMANFEPAKTRFAEDCRLVPQDTEPLVSSCIFGASSSPRTVVLYGDSHAQSLYSELDSQLKSQNIKGIFMSNNACLIPKIFESSQKTSPHECNRAANFVNSFIKDHSAQLIVAIRWTYRLYPVPNQITSLIYDNGEGGIERKYPPRINYTTEFGGYSVEMEGKSKAIREALERFSTNGKKPIVVFPIPEAGWNIPRFNFVSHLNSNELPTTITTSHANYKTRNKLIDDILESLATSGHISPVVPSKILCDTFVKNRCVAQMSGTPLYYDDDHLANAGAKLIVAQIRHLLD